MANDRPNRGQDSDADDLGDDRVRDDDFERDFGDADPPDPLGQAMPDITEAHVAEAGGPVRRTSAEDYEAHEDKHPEKHGDKHPAHPRKNIFARAIDFLKASYAELRRVQWPDRTQVGQGTAVTLGFVIVAGAYLGLLDAIWNPIIQAIL
jgi:preprotein translocase SecE subunit